MHRHLAFRCSLLLLLLCALVSPAAADGVDLSGRISETGGKGISGLTVKLIAPKKDQQPVRIAVTNDDGKFLFKGAEKKEYLLEAFQGDTLVYRDVVDVSKTQVRDIVLDKKSQ